VGWTLVVLVVFVIAAALTRRAWIPAAIKVVLRARGVKVKSVAWEGEHFLKFQGIDAGKIRVTTLTTMTPWAWKKNLATNDPQAFITVNGWRVIATNRPAEKKERESEAIADTIREFQEEARELREKCPRAVFLNGALETTAGEFIFAAVEWKNGELSGDLRWPQLNDPADFRLHVTNATKTLFILKQTALEIGSRITAEQVGENIRVAGYARWTTNRVDFDATFGPRSNEPIAATLNSKGLGLPGNLLRLREVESLNARLNLTITNGQFDLRVGAPVEDLTELSP